MRRPIAALPARSAIAAAAVLGLAACSVAGGPSPVSGTLGPISSATASGSPSASHASASQVTASASPNASALVYPVCTGPKLPARIVSWQAGAGHRTANVQVTNAGTSPCRIRVLDTPQLIDGHGSVLMSGATPPSTTAYVLMSAGAVLRTTVDVANYCGPAPDAPISLAFVFPGGNVRFIATPLSPTDTSGLPPCFGAPGSAGTITMTLWVT